MPYPTLCPEELLGWFDVAERDLPWRRPEATPWHILISEVMLQQTPVSRVEPVWREWVARWPVPSAMAKTSVAEVLRAWGKLGYPRRAMRLHECATVLARDYDDQVPGDVETLLRLPGVGAYTARAIACFGYGQRVPVVDTNVRRVIARVVHGVADSAPSARDLRDAEALLPTENGARFSAALMELGALVCTARAPQCPMCPLSSCAWHEAGRPQLDAPARPVQKYAGTDRQVRGRLLDVLRDSSIPVTRAQLDVVWLSDVAQRDRALDSLLVDGLVEQTTDGRFALAGEGG
ncbi:A/G-specific adenine glycosylase [Mycobacteroides abscessus]|uniref:A/G-specific adenine glycosylase n=1 Tax=Mycobacteroides abscessus TaxID=36809 RepID=UPI00189645C3